MIRIVRSYITLTAISFIIFSCTDSKSDEGKTLLKTKDTTITNKPIQEKTGEAGFELMKNESVGELKLGLGIKKVIEIIGKPNEKTKAELWEADGEHHQKWKYSDKGIELDFIGEFDTSLTINMIAVNKACELKTKRNIGIGNSYEEVKAAYKDVIDQASLTEEIIVAGTVYGGLIFNFENKKLKSIFIGASAE